MLRALLDLLLPTLCAGCGLAGEGWCPACAVAFAHPRRRALPGLPPVLVLAPYAGVARRAVLAYKERGRRDLAGPLAAALARALPAGCVLVPAPSRGRAARARGGDHMLRLARGTGRPVVAALRLRAGTRDSLGLDAAARAANVGRHLRLRARAAPVLRGRPVVLVDDVLTTGATARAATGLLEAAGARVVAVVVLTAPARAGHPRAPRRSPSRSSRRRSPDGRVTGDRSPTRGEPPARTFLETGRVASVAHLTRSGERQETRRSSSA